MSALDQICYGLIFVRDLTDPAVVEHAAATIADGRAYSASTAELVAAVDSALERQSVPAGALEIVEHDEAAVLGFLALLRPSLARRGL